MTRGMACDALKNFNKFPMIESVGFNKLPTLLVVVRLFVCMDESNKELGKKSYYLSLILRIMCCNSVQLQLHYILSF